MSEHLIHTFTHTMPLFAPAEQPDGSWQLVRTKGMGFERVSLRFFDEESAQTFAGILNTDLKTAAHSAIQRQFAHLLRP